MTNADYFKSYYDQRELYAFLDQSGSDYSALLERDWSDYRYGEVIKVHGAPALVFVTRLGPCVLYVRGEDVYYEASRELESLLCVDEPVLTRSQLVHFIHPTGRTLGDWVEDVRSMFLCR